MAPKRSLFAALTRAPWWLGVGLGWLVLMLGLVLIPHWLIPHWLAPNSGQLAALLADSRLPSLLTPLLWVLAGGCWLAGIVSQLRSMRRRRLLDRQTGIESLSAMSWQDFEHLVGELYRRHGYRVEAHGQAGEDGGIDLILRRDRRVVLVQCKQWKTLRVGAPVVREQYGLLVHHQADEVIVVTVGGFTRQAREFAAGKPIVLVTGSELLTLVRAVQRVSGTSTDDDEMDQEDDEAPGEYDHCPRCSAPMISRTARDSGSSFLGCSRYPACRGTRDFAA